ncbi:GNAT family N-acetyltransferase [Streptomyces sulphureus]|uniref:GNAT family N-acetyltransferase n=1 Tax=Streptomyces sulphureus TaxID=47758 RepID=UPI00056D5762|nr:GNAT family N-acetyltransferase [Streptomyces sulphureus]
MPELIPPVVRVHRSFLAAMGELRAEGRGTAEDASMTGRDLYSYGGRWADPEVFAGYVHALRRGAAEDAPRPSGFVPCTTLWYVEKGEFLGRLDLRHRLTPFLLDQGGHIGYDVRPGARGHGHATAMLRRIAPYARVLGLARTLVTCEETNVASRRVIEKSGAVYEDRRGSKLRYWLTTTDGPTTRAARPRTDAALAPARPRLP